METALFWCMKPIKRSADIRLFEKPVYDRPRHGQQTAELLKNLPETRNRIMNMLLQDTTLGPQDASEDALIRKTQIIQTNTWNHQFSLLCSSRMDKSLWVSLCLTASITIFFSIHICIQRDNQIYRTCGPVWGPLLCAFAEVIVISVIMALCAPYGLSGDRGWGPFKGTVIVTGWSLISVVVCPN